MAVNTNVISNNIINNITDYENLVKPILNDLPPRKAQDFFKAINGRRMNDLKLITRLATHYKDHSNLHHIEVLSELFQNISSFGQSLTESKRNSFYIRYFDTHLQRFINEPHVERTALFFKVTCEAFSDLKDHEFNALLNAWMNNLITSEQDLKDAIASIQLLHQKEENSALFHNTYFASIDQHALEREQLTHFLERRVIGANDTTIEDNYLQLMHLYGNTLRLNKKSYFFQENVADTHKNIVKVVRELNHIAKSIPISSYRNSLRFYFEAQHWRYLTYFTVGLRNWISFLMRGTLNLIWACSIIGTIITFFDNTCFLSLEHQHGRTKEADLLFDKLSSAEDNTASGKEYYQKIFSILEDAQQNLLDKTKGKSRLYHITIDVFTEVAKHLLCDQCVSVEDKRRLFSNGLLKQLKIYVTKYTEPWNLDLYNNILNAQTLPDIVNAMNSFQSNFQNFKPLQLAKLFEEPESSDMKHFNSKGA